MSGVPGEQGPDDDPVVDLVPVVRRVIGSRVKDPHLAEDLVQETLVRVMAARSQVNGETLVPYAATTARNVVASHLHGQALARRTAHLMLPEQSSASAPKCRSRFSCRQSSDDEDRASQAEV